LYQRYCFVDREKEQQEGFVEFQYNNKTVTLSLYRDE